MESTLASTEALIASSFEGGRRDGSLKLIRVDAVNQVRNNCFSQARRNSIRPGALLRCGGPGAPGRLGAGKRLLRQVHLFWGT